MSIFSRKSLLLASACGLIWSASPALAQSSAEGDYVADEIVVTATKRAGGELLQKVPLAITAYGQDQLQRLQFRDLSSISVVTPNAQIGAVGTVPGRLSMSIRGLGTNSSTPSDEPTVGLFVDGIYLAQTYGNLAENFDIDGIEVLRGPQGVLFGKNVTGGAVVIRTTMPRNELYVNAQTSLESGLNYTASAVVSGPLVKDKIALKVAALYNKDEGWFKDELNGNKVGGARTILGRVAARFTPTDAIDIIVRYEHGDVDSDSDVPGQNSLIRRSGFKVQNSGLGFTDIKWDQGILESNLDVGLGDGTITNIAGIRSLKYGTSFDVDRRAGRFFQSDIFVKQRQFSNELRYNGSFGALNLTTGLYYFFQKVAYQNDRRLGNGTAFTSLINGGGIQWQRTYGAFASVDWSLTDAITLNVGARYVEERKRANVAAIAGNPCVPGSALTSLQCTYDFRGRSKSNGFIPRVGLRWQADRNTMLYASWSKGLRSGGFNLQNTRAGIPAGPYGDEKQYAVEAGIKTDIANGRVRLNAAIFRAKLKDLQRARIFNDPRVGLGNILDNVADATFQGVEAEVTIRITDELSLNGSLGITDANYDKVTVDLSGDGVINDVDRRLDIVRVAPLSYSIGASYTRETQIGRFSARVDFGYKDGEAYTDNNSGYIDSRKVLNGSLALKTLGDSVTFSVYGKNLTDERVETFYLPLSAALGGGVGAYGNSLEKGRVIGVSARYQIGR